MSVIPYSTLPQTPEEVALPALPDRLLPSLSDETPRLRWIWLGVAVVFCALYAAGIFTLWAPADGGIDQNAYLVGGRMIAEHFSPRLDMHNDFQYVGGMFIRNAAGQYYPKYPFGLPLVYAFFFWILGPHNGPIYAFLVSPVSTVLSLFGMFLLARQLAGSYAAMLATILLGTSQVTLLLANNPNSHALCMACVVWGMFSLVRWWQTGSWWRGAIAGFLLGYACLVRYSEGLLVLPLAMACISRIRWKNWLSYLRCAIPMLAWTVPVASLLLFNHHTLGTWTGYDTTNESEAGAGFSWVKFMGTWEEMLRTIYDMGLFFVLPFGVAGLFMLFRRSWRAATLMLLWVVPGVALYTAYYFSPERGIVYARFFLTFFPALLVGAAVCFHDGIFSASRGEHPARRIPLSLAAGVVVLISASVGVYRACNGMFEGQANAIASVYDEFHQRRLLAQTGGILLDNVPKDAVLFADEGGLSNSPINYAQFLRRWDVFSLNAFTTNARRGSMVGRLFNRPGGGPGGPGGQGGPNGVSTDIPSPRQPAQVEHLAALYEGKSADDLMAEEMKVIDGALAAGHRVFVVASPPRANGFARDLKHDKYVITPVARWTDVSDGPPPDDQPTNIRTRMFGGPGMGGGGMGGGMGGGGQRGGQRGNANPAEIAAFSLLEIKKTP